MMCAGGTLTLASCASAKFVNTTVTPDGTLRVPRASIGTVNTVVLRWTESEIPIFLYRETASPVALASAQTAASGSTSGSASTERWNAVWMRCTHRGCQVEPTADQLVCPCHGSEFAFDGAVQKGPAASALASFAVTIEGDDLVLRKIAPRSAS